MVFLSISRIWIWICLETFERCWSFSFDKIVWSICVHLICSNILKNVLFFSWTEFLLSLFYFCIYTAMYSLVLYLFISFSLHFLSISWYFCCFVGWAQDSSWWLCSFPGWQCPAFHWNNTQVFNSQRGLSEVMCKLALPTCWREACQRHNTWSCTKRGLLLISQGRDISCIIASSV